MPNPEHFTFHLYKRSHRQQLGADVFDMMYDFKLFSMPIRPIQSSPICLVIVGNWWLRDVLQSLVILHEENHVPHKRNIFIHIAQS